MITLKSGYRESVSTGESREARKPSSIQQNSEARFTFGGATDQLTGSSCRITSSSLLVFPQDVSVPAPATTASEFFPMGVSATQHPVDAKSQDAKAPKQRLQRAACTWLHMLAQNNRKKSLPSHAQQSTLVLAKPLINRK